MRRGVEGGEEEIQLKRVETVNGNTNTVTDEEANVGNEGEDFVDYIPG